MDFIGRIDVSEPLAAFQDAWIALIKSHKSLAPVLSVKATNPFTQERIEVELRAPATTANVVTDTIEAGTIYLAMDGSPMLIVAAHPGMANAVIAVTEEIAATLRTCFVRDTDGN